jgi:hypothetical protein
MGEGQEEGRKKKVGGAAGGWKEREGRIEKMKREREQE